MDTFSLFTSTHSFTAGATEGHFGRLEVSWKKPIKQETFISVYRKFSATLCVPRFLRWSNRQSDHTPFTVRHASRPHPFTVTVGETQRPHPFYCETDTVTTPFYCETGSETTPLYHERDTETTPLLM